MKNMRKKSIALAAGLAITGIVSASAASLGGINSDSLGADTEVIAACDTADGIDVAYDTSFDAVAGVVVVNEVLVSSVDVACDGLDYEIELLNAAGNAIGEAGGTIDLSLGGGNDFDAAVAGSPVADAELAVRIAVVISGPTS